MSDTVKAVERLCWLCEEAVIRAEDGDTEERVCYSVQPLQREMKCVVQQLSEAEILKYEPSLPFETFVNIGLHNGETRHRVPLDIYEKDNETHERKVCRIWLRINEPIGGGYDERFLGWDYWKDGDYAGSKSFLNEDRRRWFCFRMRHWVRFLKVKTEELKAASAAGTSKPETTASVSQLSAEQLPQKSEADILRELFPQPRGRQTAKKVLELARAGKSQRDIAGQIGKYPSTVSGIVKKLREAGLLPDA